MKKNVCNVQFWLVGALLHSPFSSRTRPWELRSVDGIDLFDIFCFPVKYETRKNGVLRAISSNFNLGSHDFSNDLRALEQMSVEFGVNPGILKPFFNFSSGDSAGFLWLNDRARYFLDFVDKQRVNSPAVQGHPLIYGLTGAGLVDLYVTVSWFVAVSSLKKEFFFSIFLESFSFFNVFKVKYGRLNCVGGHMDSLSVLNFKLFSNWLGVSNMFCNLNYSNFLDSDFRSSFLMDKGQFFASDCIIFVGLDLRLENPSFNLRLKSHILGGRSSGLIRVFSFGNLVNPVYPVKVLGISGVEIMRFFNGSHNFCSRILRFCKSLFFLFGSGCFEFGGGYWTNFMSCLTKLRSFNLVDRVEYAFFSRYIGLLSSYEFGFQPGNGGLDFLCREKLVDNDPLQFFSFYSFNADFNCVLSSLLRKDNFFSVYQGSHFVESAVNANIVLPADFVFDKNSKFFGLDGRLSQIFNNFKYNMNSVNDYDFFKFFLSYCRDDFENFSLAKDFLVHFPFILYKRVGNFWRLSLNPGVVVDKVMQPFFVLCPNMVLGGSVFDFFISESICRNSKALLSASKFNFQVLKKRKYQYDL